MTNVLAAAHNGSLQRPALSDAPLRDVAQGVGAHKPWRAGLRVQVEHGLDARHAGVHEHPDGDA